MHLTKRILSFIVAEALRGRTWAEDAVYDSPGDIGSIRVEGDGQGIFVAVYCDEWDNKGEGIPDEQPAADTGQFKLVIEVGVAKPIVADSDDEGAATTLAATDDGLEWSIAFISRQCIDTLLDTRPAFPWSNLFQRFVSGGMLRYSIRRGGANNEGKSPAPRYASCVSILKVMTVCMEPPRGKMLTPESNVIWNDLVAMMAAREDLGGLAKLIKAHFQPVDGLDVSDLTVDAARMWVSAETMASIGLADENSLRYSPDSNTPPISTAPLRADVPMNDTDMARWLAAQGPDASQGPPDGR